MKRRRSIIIEMVIWLAVSIIAFSLTFNFNGPLENYRYGAASWPRIIIMALALFAVIEAILSLLEFRRNGGTKAVVITKAETSDSKEGISGRKVYLKRLATFGIPILFLLMMPRMGYYVCAPFFIAGLMCLLGERRPLHLIVASFLIYAVTLFVFTKLLFVPLPEGTWPGFNEISNWILVLLT
jgi:Tripartite tricarboxylate transporter TctB family